MKTEIYYFSGTGNSLKIARLIKNEVQDAHLLPMIGSLKKPAKKSGSAKIGFVFPVHGFSVPFLVKQFLSEFDFSEAKYIFAIATRGGSPCRVFKYVDKCLKKQGKSLNSAFYIDMPNTWLLYWDRPDEETLQKLFKNAYKRVHDIIKIINQEKNDLSYKRGPFLLENLLFPLLSAISKKTRYFWLDTAFYSDEKCDGCGICQQVCLAEKIELKNKKPLWKKEKKCSFCFACIHYCPKKAIQLNLTKSKERDRYHHPDITPVDISRQKQFLDV